MTDPTQVSHRMFQGSTVRLHYAIAGAGEPLVLLHGFPQTHYQWRKVMPRLAERFTVIAPDYRGAGRSQRPAGGYAKKIMADDIRELVAATCPGRPVRLVGHDMGGLVAFAWALHYPAEVARFVTIDAGAPGTGAWEKTIRLPSGWHVAFHQATDVSEMLLSGREREYVRYFLEARLYESSAVTAEDAEVYAAAYAAPGAMRAALAAYRALPYDAEENRAVLSRSKLSMPVLAVANSTNGRQALLQDMLAEMASDGSLAVVADCMHWIPEEQPEALIGILLDFL